MLPLIGQETLSDGPWQHFVEGLETGGHEVVDMRNRPARIDSLVVFNAQRGVRQLLSHYRLEPSRRALILMEPRASLPSLYRREYLDLFPHTFAASRHWSASIGGRSFLWPQDVTPERFTGERSADVTMLCANKRSAVHGSLYGLRRSVIRVLDSSDVKLALYGEGWHVGRTENLMRGSRAIAKALAARCNPSIQEALGNTGLRPLSWRGYLPSKSEGLAAAPISIVIENSADYVSEKLFDAVRHGRVPIYVGPQLAPYSIPPNIAVSVPPDARQVKAAVLRAMESGGQAIVDRGREWLQSPEGQLHAAPRVLRQLGRDLVACLVGS